MEKMLYLITQTEREGYDIYSSAVVCALNADEAVQVHPHHPEFYISSQAWDQKRLGAFCWASSPEYVTARFLGMAASDVKLGVILASFHAC